MKIIVPITDFCAKELFANELIRKQFISDVTGIPMAEIHAAYLCTPFLRRRYRKQKQGVLDVLVELNNSTKINYRNTVTVQKVVSARCFWHVFCQNPEAYKSKCHHRR